MLACGLGLSAACAAPAAADGGGAYSSVAGTISSVACIAGCSGATAQTGSVLRLRGRSLGRVRKIVFLGGNVTASTSKRSATSVEVTVPARASSGRLRAVNDDGLRGAASRVPVTIKVRSSSSGPLDAHVVGSTVYQGATRPARLDLLARKPLNVIVVLARLTDGAVVQSWPVGQLTPGVVRSVLWDGKVAGVAQPIGRYEFRVLPGAGIQAAADSGPLATDTFELVDHKFPVRGRHVIGTGAAAFGAGRAGHIHQGQDVFAKCGTKLVAARGGVVKLNKFQSAAGNYLVIDGDATPIDYVYMHLQSRSPLKKGAHVLTGGDIGRVGDTGDAVGCHLHFEMWSAPGWYTGGKPFDPRPFLQAWDQFS